MGVVIVRHGKLVRELYSFNVGQGMRFDVWSGTKSFTATAWMLALTELADVTLDTPAYSLLPDVALSDPRKAQITIRHLLSMTSGIAGEATGIGGMPTATGVGIFEFALGHAANRFGDRVDTLVADPGTRWDYSDAAYSHLSLCFHAAVGREIADYMQEKVFDKLGMFAAWDLQGGAGFRGPHTNAHTGLHLSARDLARFGLLIASGGRWNDEQVIPAKTVAEMTTVSQTLNRAYGLGWWSNSEGVYAPGLPRDLVALSGFRFNRCYAIPSLDLVVARVGTGPVISDEHKLIRAVVDAIR
jgi:CubicO group peptidase (beta-lactamase class C family)